MLRIHKYKALIIAGSLVLATFNSQAAPILQTHIVGSTANDTTTGGLSDVDTWFATGSSFSLDLIAKYANNTTSVTDAYLVLTVPDTQALLFSWSQGGPVSSVNVSSYKFETDSLFEASLPASLNNHSPFGSADNQVDVYAIPLNNLLAGLGNFNNSTSGLPDCNADTPGTTTCGFSANDAGQVKTLLLGLSGVDFAHIDLVAKYTPGNGQNTFEWNINPGSHDSTWTAGPPTPPDVVPEPGTLLLLAAGLFALGAKARRNNA